jgi:hypothetical protein
VPPIPSEVATPPDNAAALALTRQLLDRRSRRYRNLVVAVSLVGLAVPVAALVFWGWQLLLGWLFVVPLAGTALALDLRSVGRWRSTLLDGWVAGTLDLDALRDGLTAIKVLPAATIAGMVDPLPTDHRLNCFPRPDPLMREALAATARAMDRCVLRAMAVGVVALTGTVALLGSAAAVGSWWPLVGLPATLGLTRAVRRVGSRPPRGWGRRVAELAGRGLDAGALAELAGQLNWQSLPPGARERWLAALACP